jgi:hypothetical protein
LLDVGGEDGVVLLGGGAVLMGAGGVDGAGTGGLTGGFGAGIGPPDDVKKQYNMLLFYTTYYLHRYRTIQYLQACMQQVYHAK